MSTVFKCIFIGENGFERTHKRDCAQTHRKKSTYVLLLKNVILLRKDMIINDDFAQKNCFREILFSQTNVYGKWRGSCRIASAFEDEKQRSAASSNGSQAWRRCSRGLSRIGMSRGTQTENTCSVLWVTPGA